MFSSIISVQIQSVLFKNRAWIDIIKNQDEIDCSHVFSIFSIDFIWHNNFTSFWILRSWTKIMEEKTSGENAIQRVKINL